MRNRKKQLSIVACALGCVLVLCTPAVRLLTNQTTASVILFLETGHVLRMPPQKQVSENPAPTAQQTEPTAEPTVSTEPTQPPEEEILPEFALTDAELVEINSYCGYEPDVPAWLASPLNWDLQQTAPTVLILHSHGTEGYADKKEDNYRSLVPEENVVSIGDALAARLEAAGIGVIHDRTMHDNPSYSDSYENSRASAREYLARYPSIRLVLDLHRDSVEDSNGDQVRYVLETPSGTAAKLMLVVGTDAGGLTHSKWPENMSLAVKLHALLEKQNPGICRPISFRTQRFNQDLSTGALLLEMGSAGNTRQEVLLATEYLAQAIIDLAKGTA